MKKSIKWFSIIEIMIWIFIFSLWLTSVFTVLVSTLNINDYNKNFIIATNLAREQIELFRNIRDSNNKQLKKYNQINPENNQYDIVFQTWSYYKIENTFEGSSDTFSIKVDKLSSFWEWELELNWKMQNYRLYLDNENRYVYEKIWNKPTEFYRFLQIDEVKDKDWIINNSLKIKSKVIWYKRWYHEYEINTIIADWIRL